MRYFGITLITAAVMVWFVAGIQLGRWLERKDETAFSPN